MKNTVLITGTNRGLGLEFTKQYAQSGWQVLACCRDMTAAKTLQQLATQYANIRLFTLDVADFAQIDALALVLEKQPIDLLINNAGIYPNSSLRDVSYDDWQTAFKINSMAPFKMVQTFLPNLIRGSLKKVATLTSKMGSIDDNTSGGSYIYRTSKVAVNMVMKSLATDLQTHGIAVVTLHPGWVLTDMGGTHALISAQTSVAGLRQRIEHLTLASSGKFLAYDGKEILW